MVNLAALVFLKISLQQFFKEQPQLKPNNFYFIIKGFTLENKNSEKNVSWQEISK